MIEERLPNSYHPQASGNHFMFRLMGVGLTVEHQAVCSVGGYWQAKYSVLNARMVEAVQLLARTEGIPLDPVYTGKIMAGLIGLARAGELAAGERVLFIHTGGLPSLHTYEDVVLGEGGPIAP